MRKSERIWQNVLRGETFLFRFLFSAVLILLLSQAVLFRDDTRTYFSRVDYLEGQPISAEEGIAGSDLLENVINTKQTLRKSKAITIHMIKPAQSNNVSVTVNGQAAGDFTNGYVTFSVYSGDFVEIDATKMTQTGQYIVNTDANELKSINGLLLESKHNIVTLGKIKYATN
ncbi:MAG: hypothetical protein LLG02_06585 [Pelosinus sp.]|nr:hypothetical protein [Pelosinus sp.]